MPPSRPSPSSHQSCRRWSGRSVVVDVKMGLGDGKMNITQRQHHQCTSRAPPSILYSIHRPHGTAWSIPAALCHAAHRVAPVIHAALDQDPSCIPRGLSPSSRNASMAVSRGKDAASASVSASAAGHGRPNGAWPALDTGSVDWSQKRGRPASPWAGKVRADELKVAEGRKKTG